MAKLTDSDVGKVFMYEPDGELCELKQLASYPNDPTHQRARCRFKGYYALTDAMNLRPATEAETTQFRARKRS